MQSIGVILYTFLLLVAGQVSAKLIEDATFGKDGYAYFHASNWGSVDNAYVLPDGSILSVMGFGFAEFTLLVKTNAEAKLDLTFGDEGSVPVQIFHRKNSVNGLTVDSKGMIYVSGDTWTPDWEDHYSFILRYFPDGRQDYSFGKTGMMKINLREPDDLFFDGLERLNVVTHKGILRLTKDLTPDGEFGSAGYFIDSSLYMSGIGRKDDDSLFALNYWPGSIIKIKKGILDLGFGNAGRLSLPLYPDSVNSFINRPIVRTPDSKMILVSLSDDKKLSLRRFDLNFNPDLTFGINGEVKFEDSFLGKDFRDEPIEALVLDDGRIIAIGYSNLTDSLDQGAWLAEWSASGALLDVHVWKTYEQSFTKLRYDPVGKRVILSGWDYPYPVFAAFKL